MDNFQKAKDCFLKGIEHLEAGAFEDAERQFLDSLLLVPDRASTLTNLAVAQVKLKKYSDAKYSCERALAADQNNSEALLNLGLIYKDAKDHELALRYFDEAITRNLEYASAWSNRGCILRELHQYNNALTSFDKAISLDESYHEAWSNRGIVLYDLKRYKESLLSHQHAIALQANYADAWFNMGITHLALKEYQDALHALRKAYAINPRLEHLLGDLIHNQLLMCDWRNVNENIKCLMDELRAGHHASSPFPTLSAMDSPNLQREAATLWANYKFPANNALPQIQKRNHSKIRLGYFSADFKEHPVSLLTAGLYELHDRSKFEVIAFSLQSSTPGDFMRSRLVNSFDQFIDVESLSDLEIAKLARELEIDIAIDLGGYTQFGRPGIFSYRSAPIQISYIGYLGTMGASYIDYLIADRIIIPENAKEFYSEKIAYLPSYQVNDSARIAHKKKFTRQDLGLPQDCFVFTCFNNNFKLLPENFDCWIRILKACDNSVLFLYAENQWSKSNLIQYAKDRGIDEGRLVFSGRAALEDYLARLEVCDLFLDTLPYNAGTTASDALWVGLPVITCIGESFASRVAASLLTSIQLPELITTTYEEYENLAIELAMNPLKLAHIRERLSHNRHTTQLFNTSLFTKSIEGVYKRMYEQYQQNLPPDHLEISASA